MKTYRTEAVVPSNKTIVLENLPFEEGDQVIVIISLIGEEEDSENINPEK